MKKSEGTVMWDKAKTIIPGGTGLFSKRSEMFLPGNWPSYYEKAKGAEIWDVAGKKYTDMSIMGVGACILGYADEDVNRAVKQAVDKASLTTLNCPEDIELAELLLGMHPWAGMVRYARSGGEAMALAVRIARAHTGKDKVAFCGYHGWHDWYLSANLGETEKDDGKRIPGFKPAGVPRALRGTSIPFNYNNIDELEKIVEKNRIGVIAMEVVRNREPDKGFLENVRKTADEAGAVLIFDEITSGFRMNVGGIHMLYSVRPDIAVYGKAMSNGFPMAAVVGRKEVMESAEKSFISSTYWTERIGPAASIATLKKLKEKNVPSHLCKIGDMVNKGWESISRENGLEIKITGISPLTTFSFSYEEGPAMHTLFNQEMLKRGFLTSKSVYACYSHTEEHVKKYLAAANDVFGIIKKSVDKGNVREMLEGPVIFSGFTRLND